MLIWWLGGEARAEKNSTAGKSSVEEGKEAETLCSGKLIKLRLS